MTRPAILCTIIIVALLTPALIKTPLIVRDAIYRAN